MLEGIKRTFKREKPISLHALARDEKLDPEEFLRRKLSKELEEERTFYEGMNQETIAELRAIRDGKKEGENKEALLIGMGGAMRGTQGASQLLALSLMGYQKAFKRAIGYSALSAPVLMFASRKLEQVQHALEIFVKKISNKTFIDLKRGLPFTKGETPVLNLPFLKDILSKVFDQEAVRNSPIDCYVGATDGNTKESTLVSIRNTASVIDACEASSAAPIVYGKKVKIDGRELMDGDFNPHSLEEILKQFPTSTTVIIIPNIPFMNSTAAFGGMKRTFAKVAGALGTTSSIGGSMGSMGSFSDLQGYILASRKFRESLEFIRKQKGVKVAVLWTPDCGVGNLTIDESILTEAALRTVRATFKEFSEEQIKDIPLFPGDKYEPVEETKEAAA